jgi:hypothetical protein
MSDDDPISYEVLAKGTPLLSSAGTTFGTVEHVLQDSSLDLFDGIAVRVDRGVRFVDASQVTRITRGAVHTSLTDDEAASLPEPEGEPVLSADPDQYQENNLSAYFGKLFFREHWTHKKHEE